MARIVKSKNKQRNYFSIVVCKALDVDGYHVSVMDIDTQEVQQGTIFGDNPKSTNELALAVGRCVLNLMRFKI